MYEKKEIDGGSLRIVKKSSDSGLREKGALRPGRYKKAGYVNAKSKNGSRCQGPSSTVDSRGGDHVLPGNLKALIVSSTAAMSALAGIIAAPTLAEDRASPVISQLPAVSAPIPQTAASHAFLGAQERMAAGGYVEEEYFLSGQANVYDWVGSSRNVKVVAGPTSYVTRILVRRPKNPARFSGNVELNVLNATLAVDRGGPTDLNRMIADGDAWIGITSKALTVKALKRFDPVRYASLNWSNPVPPEQRCQRPSIIPLYTMGGEAGYDQMRKMGMSASGPDTEDGLIWDMLGQIGLLLKSDAR